MASKRAVRAPSSSRVSNTGSNFVPSTRLERHPKLFALYALEASNPFSSSFHTVSVLWPQKSSKAQSWAKRHVFLVKTAPMTTLDRLSRTAPTGPARLPGLPASWAKRHLSGLPASWAKRHLSGLPASWAKRHLSGLPASWAKRHLSGLPASWAKRHLSGLPAENILCCFANIFGIRQWYFQNCYRLLKT